jgi:hypothetical protein
MDGLSRTYEALLAGTYDCLDRIVVNAYFRMATMLAGFACGGESLPDRKRHSTMLI